MMISSCSIINISDEHTDDDDKQTKKTSDTYVNFVTIDFFLLSCQDVCLYRRIECLRKENATHDLFRESMKNLYEQADRRKHTLVLLFAFR